MLASKAKYIGWVAAVAIAGPVSALDTTSCPATAGILLQSCGQPVSVNLRILPDEITQSPDHLLTVAGTYSSGDRFGIEGLVIKDGVQISRRYQNWDGVLIIAPDGRPNIYRADDVTVDGANYNLKDAPSRRAFIQKALESRLTVLQSHLLISGGNLDLSDVPDAPKFKRRLFVTLPDGSFGIWETEISETLYDAAVQLQAGLGPYMALNLDMGAYDYCQKGPVGDQSDCGRLLVSKDKLTNVLEFSHKK
ncbi:succinate dehydrogenase [Amylibacter sp. SFDW26]|uniref:succinate dehydrogenase n=1 Tax=Amylibacter sp. SFDW26 TaxID=2652722 RepID=UPI00126206BF|nr:succinate dehydrogenase [Amylibacter sp. SFDW26]KAB7615248.1 succinate dehydrogenase [Amylibacter sp. SFDW26]